MEFTDSSDILALALHDRVLTGQMPVLLINADTNQARHLLEERGLQVKEWCWTWSKERSKGVYAWPPLDLEDDAHGTETVILRLPAIRELTTLTIEVAAALMSLGAELYVYGSNQEGMKSVADHLAPWFEAPEVLALKHRERVVRAVRSEARGARENLSDWQQVFNATLDGKKIPLISYPGMFAHGSLDAGTKLLLEHLPDCTAASRVLDMGTGSGVLARAIQERTPGVSIMAIDRNAFAVVAAKKNAPGIQALWGDSWNAVDSDVDPAFADHTFDLIISNPPVHEGTRQTTDMVEYFIKNTKKHLALGGSITIVMQRTIPMKSLFNDAVLKPQLVAENETYQVWRGYRNDDAIRL